MVFLIVVQEMGDRWPCTYNELQVILKIKETCNHLYYNTYFETILLDIVSYLSMAIANVTNRDIE